MRKKYIQHYACAQPTLNATRHSSVLKNVSTAATGSYKSCSNSIYCSTDHPPCLRLVELPQGMKERPVSVLASADAAGVVVLSICGAYRLITIDLRSHRTVAGKGKGGAFPGGRLSPSKVDSPRQRRPRRSSGLDTVGAAGSTESDGDADGAGPGVRPLQLTLSADLSLLSALVEVDGHIELIQVMLVGGTKTIS